MAAACAAGCTDSSTTPTPSTRIFVTPGSQSFSQIGATATLHAGFQSATTPPPDSFWHFTSTNPSVATVSGGGPNPTVTAVGNGSAVIHITLDTVVDTADVTVTVNAPTVSPTAYNGRWKGDALISPLSLPIFRPLACAGSDQKYGETMTINVDASGSGTATITDSPGFDRAYNVTIPQTLTFSGSGTFSFLGAAVPAKLSATLNSVAQLTFTETTTWGSCSNTYGGTLTKQ